MQAGSGWLAVPPVVLPELAPPLPELAPPLPELAPPLPELAPPVPELVVAPVPELVVELVEPEPLEAVVVPEVPPVVPLVPFCVPPQAVSATLADNIQITRFVVPRMCDLSSVEAQASIACSPCTDEAGRGFEEFSRRGCPRQFPQSSDRPQPVATVNEAPGEVEGEAS